MATNNPNTANLFARFRELVERADAETRRDGAPYGETKYELEAVDAILNMIDSDAARKSQQHTAFMQVLRHGYHSDASPYVTLMVDSELGWQGVKSRKGVKAMTEADDTTGGYLASGTFAAMVHRATADYSPVRQLARVVPITGGNALLQPVRSGIPTARRVSETGSRAPGATGSDLSFRLENIPTPELFTSTIASRAMLMDSTYPLDQEIAEAAARAFAVQEGKEFVLGIGAGGEMLGLNLTALPAAQVVTCADSSGHKVAADEIIKLVDEAFKPQYLPNARFLLHVKQLSAFRKLRASTDGPYLYAPGLGGRAGTILDIPYTLSPDLDIEGTAAGKIVAYVGDFRQAFAVAVRNEIVVQRVVEAKAELGQVEFIIFERVGGSVILPDALSRIVTA